MDSKKNFKEAIGRIQDAEQLLQVGAERGKLSVIERDILLEKLRACYELVLFDRFNADAQLEQLPEEKESNPPHPKQDNAANTLNNNLSEPLNSADSVDRADPLPKVDKIDIKEEVKPRNAEGNTDKSLSEEIAEEIEFVEPEPVVIENTLEDYESGNGKTTLAERYQGKTKSRNETLGNGKKDIASVLKGKPISDLTKAIGINDKFLFTKELFGGNAGLYTKTIKTLNNFDDINDAIIFIQDNFSWDDSNEAANQLIELVRRKLLHD